MSNNLLESLKQHLSGDVVSNLAAFIGESPANTASALNTALPTVLAGLVGQGTDSNSIGNLFKLLSEGNHDGGVLSNLGALSRGGDETAKLVSEGRHLLTSLFGDNSDAITDLIANANGIGKKATGSLLGFITPLVLGMVGKNLKIGGTNSASGLASLLSDQSGFLKDAIPAGLSSLLTGVISADAAATAGNTISDFDKAANQSDANGTAPTSPTNTATIVSDTLVSIDDEIEDEIEDIAEETSSSAENMAEDIDKSVVQLDSQRIEESKEFSHSAAVAIEEGAGEGGKFLPWILILAALALAWGLLKSCSVPDPATNATAPTTTTAPSVAPPQETSLPPAAPVVAAPPPTPTAPEPAKVEAPATDSNIFEKTLSDGYAIKSAKDGFVSKLLGFIEGGEAVSKDLWFTMDGITFDTNKATIKEESTIQINDIAEILKAYPKVKIKIGGYTDNTGKANANKTLSDNRAKAVKQALVSKGIKGDRIETEGYGSDNSVASNDTPEGQQKNRRIDVRVTEK
ncbi:putative K(+)-stimulated pyrophosphate-energized sodium pump [Methyloglobulus morosus KoM1]|uniref:Putative K(+)-stimulated pyrophosphate-energized sodium pump n=1 Tax=Methyloglobulus morosus KoM1 TaxID=1116472 RepID=V5CAC0_9GAMM|nr:OmpA family protein [Methyloglobulus morosus]ESS73758.1 putative K(+)-stimulated pyrophosphate-energized sodium pump [Methyloglobulus morosus KoM1]